MKVLLFHEFRRRYRPGSTVWYLPTLASLLILALENQNIGIGVASLAVTHATNFYIWIQRKNAKEILLFTTINSLSILLVYRVMNLTHLLLFFLAVGNTYTIIRHKSNLLWLINSIVATFIFLTTYWWVQYYDEGLTHLYQIAIIHLVSLGYMYLRRKISNISRISGMLLMYFIYGMAISLYLHDIFFVAFSMYCLNTAIALGRKNI